MAILGFRRKRRSVRGQLWAVVVKTLLLALALLLSMIFLLRFVPPPTSAFMLQRAGQARAAGRADFAVRYRWVPLSELPAHVPVAVISAEDQRFSMHDGFDFRAMRESLADRVRGRRLRGASTISQQVAKNLFLWEDRSLVRKALEACLTVVLEGLWPKRRILEVYLNIAELGDGVFGVGAAARHHFHCDARNLTREQAAMLAAILPDPRRRHVHHPSPRVRRKQRWILEQMPIVAALQPGLAEVQTRQRP